MPDCDVVIVNYNAGELLAKCVDAVTNSLQSVNVFIVDNNSSDDSMDFPVQTPKVQKIYRKHNHGFAKSSNYAARLGRSEFLLILNPDCLLEAETLPVLLNELTSHAKFAMMGCLICNPDGSEQRAARRRLPTFWRTFFTVTRLEKLAKVLPFFAGVNLSHKKLPQNTEKVEAVSGAFMLLRRKVFEELEGFDELFPMHFEDLDLMKRLQERGWTIGLNPNVKAIHYQGTSSKSNPNVEAMKRQGLCRYFAKHEPVWSHKIVSWLLRVKKN